MSMQDTDLELMLGDRARAPQFRLGVTKARMQSRKESPAA